MTLPPSVSPLEIVWTLITLIGSGLAAINWYDAWGDLIELRRSGRNGILLIAAKGEWLDHGMIVTTMLCDFVVGFLALFALPGREPDGDPSLSSILAAPLIILGALALIYLSFAKKRRRKKIMSALRGQQDDVMQRRHAEVTASLTEIHKEIDDNTRLTAHAAERADAAYEVANNVNDKLAVVTRAAKESSDLGNIGLSDVLEVSEDTNQRVKRVEDAVTKRDTDP